MWWQFQEQPEDFQSKRLKNLFIISGVAMKQEGGCSEKWDVETKYMFWAVFCVLFQFDTLSASEDTNVEAFLFEHSSYKHSM
jgi:hypothetical protein